jgi:hypothetical protein
MLGADGTHFGAGSVLSAIRNRISFHYSDKENLTEASFRQLPESEPLQFYLTTMVGNSFYHAAELVVQFAAINLVKTLPADPNDSASAEARAFGALCDEVIRVSDHITDLFGELIAALSEDVVGEVATEELPDGPKLSTFCLPYFFDEDDPWPFGRAAGGQAPAKAG